MTTVTTDPQTEEIRRACDFLQSSMADLDRAGIPKKKLRRQLQLVRLCITTMKRHYPKAPEIHAELTATHVYKIVSAVQSALNEDRALPQDQIQLLRSFLEFPERFHDSFADMFHEQFPTWEVWFAEEHRKIMEEHAEDDMFVFELSEKVERKWKKRHERERKAFYNG